jgi:RpiB/LacA/LacB family sugar-phosphate isomerase
MKVALGSDHRGDAANLALLEHLREAGHDVTVHGNCDGTRCDYPDNAWLVGQAVARGEAERGILICSNGIGMSIAANKIPMVRAALVYSVANALQSRRHNDANVLCLGGDTNSHDELFAIVDAWMNTGFEGGRHAQRVAKIEAIEAGRDPRGDSDSPGMSRPYASRERST